MKRILNIINESEYSKNYLSDDELPWINLISWGKKKASFKCYKCDEKVIIQLISKCAISFEITFRYIDNEIRWFEIFLAK